MEIKIRNRVQGLVALSRQQKAAAMAADKPLRSSLAKKNICLAAICIILIISVSNGICESENNGLSLSYPNVKLVQGDRILILAPHPDDEVLGCAGVIQKATALKLPIKIAFFTYGDNNEWSFLLYRKHPVIMPKAVQGMGLVRHDEAVEADKTLGVHPESLFFLGYPDFRTLNIWYSGWADSPPVKSIFTQVRAVPYANAFRPGAPYKGEEILKDLKEILNGFKPTKIFVSHPADHNPDHKALYLFTRIALWDLENKLKPEIYPYIMHYKHWPKPTGYNPGIALQPPGLFKEHINWESVELSDEEISRKFEALKKHRSQYNDARELFLSFIHPNELFGDFPVVSLVSNNSSVLLSPHSREKTEELPEQLIYEEQAAFVGFEERFVRLEDNDFVLSVKLSKPLGQKVGLSLYIFGYRPGRDFSEMPKLHIKFGRLGYSVYNRNHRLPKDTIKFGRKPREVTVSVPLEVLGNPKYILTSAHTYLGFVPLDWVSWQVLEIKKKKSEL